MRNLIRITLGLFVAISFMGCLEDQLETDVNAPADVYVLSVDGDSYSVETIEAKKLSEFLSTPLESRGGSQSATGNLHDNGFLATFNAISNNGGMHGNTHLCCDDFFIDVKFDSECLYIIENKAYWGGTITVWEVNDGGQLPFDVGWQLYWTGIDNGEGNNAESDLMGDAFIVVPPGFVAEEFGYPSWCHFADADYNGNGPNGPNHTHGYAEGEIMNVQVK